jgi:hypothetical protein
MDPQRLSSLIWAVTLIVLLGLTAMAIVWVRRRIGPGADEAASSSANPPDWISLLNSLQGGRIEPKSWTSLAPFLVAQANACPRALRAPIIVALDREIADARDPLARMSMNQVRTALAAAPAA